MYKLRSLLTPSLCCVGTKGAWEQHDAPHNVPPHEPMPANVGGYGRFNYPGPPPPPGQGPGPGGPVPAQFPPNPYMMHHHAHPGGPGESSSRVTTRSYGGVLYLGMPSYHGAAPMHGGPGPGMGRGPSHYPPHHVNFRPPFPYPVDPYKMP